MNRLVVFFIASILLIQAQKEEDFLLSPLQDFTQVAYLQLASNLKNENFVFSPLSLHSALTLVFLGSKENTKTYKELQKSLGGLINTETLKYEYRNYIEFLNENPEVLYGNHIWLRNGISIKKGYRETLQEYFYAGASTIDFKSSEAIDKVNKWISKYTNGKINELVRGFNENTLMFISNALYFKDSWLYTFDEFDSKGRKIKDIFQTPQGEKEVEMIELTSATIKHEVFKINNLDEFVKFEAVKIPYKNENFDLKIIIPSSDSNQHSLAKLESFANFTYVKDKRTEHDFNLFSLVGESEFSGEVRLKMPSFSVKSKIKAKDMFVKMQVNEIFSDNAELDYITDEKPITISDIAHEAVIEVTSNGTEGAAATGVELVFFSASLGKTREVTINKPFIFILEDNQRNIPILVGRVVNPVQ